jgi:hypothetical protein
MNLVHAGVSKPEWVERASEMGNVECRTSNEQGIEDRHLCSLIIGHSSLGIFPHATTLTIHSMPKRSVSMPNMKNLEVG